MLFSHIFLYDYFYYIFTFIFLGIFWAFHFFDIFFFSAHRDREWEDAYHREMGARVREKMENSLHLDPEDHDWMATQGIRVSQHTAPVETGVSLPPGDSLHIAIMMPFLDQ